MTHRVRVKTKIPDVKDFWVNAILGEPKLLLLGLTES